MPVAAPVPNDLMSRFQAVAGSNPAPGATPKPPHSDVAPPPAPSDDMMARFGKVAQGGTSAAPQQAQEQPEDTDFLSRASQTSGIHGLIESAKAHWDAAKQTEDENQAVIKQVTDLAKAKDFGRATELLLSHLTKGALMKGATALVPGGEAGLNVAESSAEHLGKMGSEFGKGNIGEGVVEAATAVPVVGPMARSIAEPAAADIKSGNAEGFAGDVVGGAAQIGSILLGRKGAPEADTALPPAKEPIGPETQVTKGTRAVAGGTVPTVEKVAAPAEGRTAAEVSEMKATAQKTLEKTYAKETEPAAKGIFSKGITDAAKKIDPSAPEMATMEDYGKHFTEKGHEVWQKADEISRRGYTAAKPATASGVLDESGKMIMKDGSPAVGEPVKFTDLQKSERAAWRSGDFDKANDLRMKQEEFLDRHANEFEPGALKEARKNYAIGSSGFRIHDALNSTAVIGETPDELIANKNVPDPGMWRGKAFLRTIRKLNGPREDLSESEFKQAKLPQQTVANWQELGRVLTKEGNMNRFNAIFRQVAATPEIADSIGKQVGDAVARKTVAGAAGSVLGGPLGAGAAVAADQWLLPKIMERISYNPQAMKTLVTGLKSSATAAAIANALRPYLKEEKK